MSRELLNRQLALPQSERAVVEGWPLDRLIISVKGGLGHLVKIRDQPVDGGLIIACLIIAHRRREHLIPILHPALEPAFIVQLRAAWMS